MKKTVVDIPQKVTNNFQAMVFFIETYEKTRKCYAEEVVLNFEETKVFESNLFSVLGCLIATLEKKRNKVRLLGLQESISNLFNTKKLINGATKKFLWKHLIKCQYFGTADEEALSEYLETRIFPERPDVTLNPHLKMAVQLCVAEVFRNAFVHSQCHEVFIAHYFSVYNKKLYITVASRGKTLKEVVTDKEFSRNDISAIEWAVKSGTSSKRAQKGGIGLFTIRQFIEQNQGKIQILSGNGVWKQVGHRTFSKMTDKAFPGTVTTLEFNLKE